MSKSEYNRNYYLKNKQKIKERAKEREKQPEPVAPPAEVLNQFPIFTLGLVVISSALLLIDMVAFYESWVRAFVFETLILVFSVIKARTTWIGYLYKTVAVGLYILSLYGMSSVYVERAIQNSRIENITEKSIQELEKTISMKEQQRDEFFLKDWISAGRKSETSIDDLKIKLQSLRTQFVNLKPLTLHSTVIQIVCRVFLMLGNVLLLKRLVEGTELSEFSTFRLKKG